MMQMREQQMREQRAGPRAMGDFNQHFWQLRALARSADLDLGEAMREHRISAMDYAAIVTRCRAAGCAQRCALWLAANAHLKGEIPEFCVNKEALEALREA